MSRLPFRKLKLGPHRWDVKFADLGKEDVRTKKYKKASEECGKHPTFYGDCSFEDTLIRLNTNLNKDMLGEVLLHECIHVGIDECGLSEQIKMHDEELVVQALSVWLLQALRDNPKFLEFLGKKS